MIYIYSSKSVMKNIRPFAVKKIILLNLNEYFNDARKYRNESLMTYLKDTQLRVTPRKMKVLF